MMNPMDYGLVRSSLRITEPPQFVFEKKRHEVIRKWKAAYRLYCTWLPRTILHSNCNLHFRKLILFSDQRYVHTQSASPTVLSHKMFFFARLINPRMSRAAYLRPPVPLGFHVRSGLLASTLPRRRRPQLGGAQKVCSCSSSSKRLEAVGGGQRTKANWGNCGKPRRKTRWKDLSQVLLRKDAQMPDGFCYEALGNRKVLAWPHYAEQRLEAYSEDRKPRLHKELWKK